jgi:hypothetical protein
MTGVAAYSPTSVTLRTDKENPVSSSIAGKLGGIEKAKNTYLKQYIRQKGICWRRSGQPLIVRVSNF